MYGVDCGDGQERVTGGAPFTKRWLAHDVYIIICQVLPCNSYCLQSWYQVSLHADSIHRRDPSCN